MDQKNFLEYLYNPKVAFVILLLAVVLPYSNIFPNEFVYDDPSYFVTWEGIKNIDLGAYFAGDQPINFYHLYRPMRTIIQAVVYKFTDSNPFGYHIFSILVHFINTFLVFLIAKKLINNLAAFATALFFAVLPVHVMSVTFMTASFNTAGVIFIFLSFYLYILFREKNLKKYFYLSLAMAVIAYFSYEAALVLPLIFILYEICFQKTHPKNIVSHMKYLGWYFLAGFIFFFIRSEVLKGLYTKPFLIPIEFSTRIFTETKALMKYIYLTVINYPLDVYHHIELSKSFDTYVILSLLILLSLLFLACVLWKRGNKIYTFIIFWFFIGLLPYSNIIQIASFIDEQYQYLSSFSWALFLGHTFSGTIERYKNKDKKYTHFAILGFMALAIIYGYITWARNFEWKNNETLWTKTIKLNPNYGRSYTQIAEYYKDKGDFIRAEEYLNSGISKFPQFSTLRVTLGDLYFKKDDFQKAEEQYLKAIELRPNYAPVYHNLGYLYLKEGNYKKAEENFRKTIEISPLFYESIFNLAVLLLDQKKFTESQSLFERAIKLRKKDPEAYFGLGMSFMGLKDNARAQEYFNKALILNPHFAPAQEKLDEIK